MEVIVVLDIRAGVATVRLPDTSQKEWSVASLPFGVLPGDRVGVVVEDGDMEMVILPGLAGLRA